MSQPIAPGAALIIDLHAIRAGLAGELARLDLAEAMRRQAAGRPAFTIPEIRVGDVIRNNATGELGTVLKVPEASDTFLLQFPGRIYAARRAEISLGAPVELPSDCEAAS